MKNGLITRADDFGSARAADEAILEAVASGSYVRNVSCMAVGATIAQSAGALSDICRKVDIGLHFTLNSEWDTIKWIPCMPKEKIPSLLDQNGEFYQSREGLKAASPRLEEILSELEAQLERLQSLGLPVSYVDTHMGPDAWLPGLAQHMQEWADKKGLLYVRRYYEFLPERLPEFAAGEAAYQQNVEKWLDSFEEGKQYLAFMHPAKLSDETMAFANAGFRPGIVAWERELEYRSAISEIWQKRSRERELTLLRYRDAAQPRITLEEMGDNL